MQDVLEEMSRYGGHSDPPPIQGHVYNRWLRELKQGADDLHEALREIDRLRMENESLKARRKP